MFKLILVVLSLLLYGQVFEAGGPGWDPNGSPVPQEDDAGPTTDGGPGWDPDGLK